MRSGQQVNPALVKGQIVGGSWMGMGHVLQETTAPYYPAIDHAPGDFQSYVIPGAADMPSVECEVLEIASRNGPFGAKGVGEMATNSPIPAIVNAINNALGVRITQIPVTPEVVLRALDEKAANATRSRAPFRYAACRTFDSAVRRRMPWPKPRPLSERARN